MQAKSNALGRTLALTVTTPTRELDSTSFLGELIHPYTSYQVLASPPLLSYDADSLLLAAFPLSVNKLLDITLTFTILDQDKEVNYLGRYLIFDRRLVGIKLSSSKNDGGPKQKEFKKWPTGKIMKYKLPKRVMDYYINCGDLQEYQGEIFVGDFLLTIGDLRIGTIFESQLQDGEATLYQYKKQGCEIFSVVCDMPRDPIFQASLNTTNARLATKTQSILKRFSRQNNRSVLYCGSRIATPYGLFLTNSFILDPELPEMNISPFYFSQAHSLTLLCNIKVITKDQVYNHRREKITDRFRNELYVDSQLLPIPLNPGKNDRIFVGKYKQTENTSKQHRQLLKKMKIWYYFTSQNKQNPFIISLPLSDGMEEIVNQLFSLSKLVSIPISSLVVFFKVNKDVIVSESIQSQGVLIYQTLQFLLADPQFSILNIYTQNRGQEQYLLTLSDKNYKIRVFFNSIQLKQKPQFRIKNEKTSKMMQFANSIVKNRICGYYKVLREARSEAWRFNLDEQIEAITVHLKNRLRCQVNLHPFFKNILSKNSQDIKQALFQAQQAIIQPYQSNISIEAMNNSNMQCEQKNTELELKEKEFFSKMKQFKKSRNLVMKRLQTKCHKCQAYFDKIYIYRCSSCRTEICFICITENLELQPKNRRELVDQLKCLVCKRLCNCSKCLGRQRPDESLMNSSMFRLDNTTQRSITIEDKQDKEDYKQFCTACLIKGRKNTRIKICCSTCDNVECLQCYRNQSMRKTPLGPDWQCLTCKPDEQVPARELMPQQEFQRTPERMDIEVNNRNTNKSPPTNSKSPLQNSSKQKASVSRSKSPVRNTRLSPEKYNFNKDGSDNRNGYNNRENNYRGRGRGGFNRNSNNSGNNFNNNNSSFNNNNQSQNRPSFDNKRSVSASRSRSPPRKNNADNEGGKINKKHSPSRSVSKSPPRNQKLNINRNTNTNTNNKKHSPSRSVSKSPSRNQKPNTNNNNNKKKSPSRSVSKSPPRNAKKNANMNVSRNESRSNSPKNKPNPQDKKRSISRSVSKSPPKKVQQQQKKRSLSNSRSKSKSPPKRQQEKRKSSPSRSRSPQNKQRNSNRSNSRQQKSKSRSRSRQREHRKQKQSYPTPKLWNNQRRDNKDNWNNRDRNNNNQSNFNRNDRGGRGRGRGGYNRGGNQGGYNRDNKGYNRQDNNRGYNSYNNSNNNSKDQKETSQILNVSQANIEQNFECDY